MSEYIPPDQSQKGRLISKSEAKRLLKKLQMKYGAELQAVTDQMKHEKETLGYVTPETEAKNEIIIEKIKAEEKHYL